VNLAPELTRRFGRVQGVFSAPVSPKQVDAIVAHLEDAFTRGALEAERRRGPSAPQETLFEDAVAVTNRTIGRLFGEAGVELDPRQAVGAIMAVKNGIVIAAVWGSPELLLYRFRDGDRTKIFNLLADEAAAKGRTGFTSVISGEMSPGDRLLCSTRSVRDLIGPEKLERAMREDPAGAVERMREDLTEADETAAVAVLVADVAETRYVEEEEAESPAQRTVASVRALERTTAVTNEVLSPSLAKSVRGAARTVAGGFASTASSLASTAGSLASSAAEAVRERREEARRLADERAKAEAEAMKVPSWLRPGDRIVGESKLEIQGQRYTVPIIDLEETEFDIAKLSEEERGKTRVRWAEGGSGMEDATPASEPPPSAPEEAPAAPKMPRQSSLLTDIKSSVTTQLSEEAATANETAENDRPGITEPPPPVPTEPAPPPSETIVVDWRRVVQGAARWMTGVGIGLAGTIRALLSPEGRRDLPGRMRLRLRRAAAAWRSLPLGRKAMFWAVAGLIVLAVAGLIARHELRLNEERRMANARLLETVTQGLDDAEASLIYKDEARAFAQLQSAVAALEQYQPSNPEEEDQRNALAAQIKEKMAAFRKETALGPPTAETAVGDAASGRVLRLVAGEGADWFATQAGQVFRQKDGEASARAVASLPAGAVPVSILAVGDGVVVAAADGSILRLDAGGKPAASHLPDGVGISDAEVYANRLYVLDAAHNRIMRYGLAGGWKDGQPYVQDGTDLSGAAAMAIDSNIYVLKPDGTLIKLYRGSRVEFRLTAVEPPLTNARRLAAPDGSDDLYVLEPSVGRIIRFTRKDGTLVAQYVSDALTGATDFAVDAAAKTITAAVGNKVLMFGIPE
jgi:hypothetical protein